MEQARKVEKEKEQVDRARKKQLKDHELKKQQIADYKRKKLEAEEMLANADLGDLEDYGGEAYTPDIGPRGY